MIFTLRYWWRYNGDESDFDIVKIEADNLEQAKEIVFKIRKWIFRIEAV